MEMEPILEDVPPEEAYPRINRNFDRLNQEIAGIKGGMVVASFYGVGASIRTDDATELLNELFAEAKSQGTVVVSSTKPFQWTYKGKALCVD